MLMRKAEYNIIDLFTVHIYVHVSLFVYIIVLKIVSEYPRMSEPTRFPAISVEELDHPRLYNKSGSILNKSTVAYLSVCTILFMVVRISKHFAWPNVRFAVNTKTISSTETAGKVYQ